MAPKVYDRVKEYTVSTGVGGITFVGAFNGFQKFSDVLTSGDTTYYVIEENDKWEVGIGTYGSNNLDRTTVLTSSNNGNKVSLGGSGVVSITYPAGRAAFSDEVDYVSGVAVYASGLVGGGSATVDQVNYVSGIAVYSSGQAITNKTDISTNSSDINYVSGVANYASGQAVDNESQISSVSGWADSTFLKSDDDSYILGIATYASGQSIENESDIATNTSNISTNTGRVNYASGLAITNELNVAYASGQAIANETDIATNTSNISTNTGNISTNTARVNYASGQAIANESDIATNTSNISTNTSNISTNTARVAYASGQAIENESQISSVSGWASVYADAGDVSVSGWASSTFLSSDDDSYVSGVAVYASGQAIANESDIVYISGIAVYASGNSGGGAAYDDTYLSGIAVYSSGQAIENESQISSVSGWAGVYADAGDASVSGWADSTFIKVDDDSYVSGIAAYASGQAIENESLATYASGQAIENETDIVYISGIAVYASGNTLQRVTDNGASTTNAITITNNNITASSGLFDALDMTPLGNGSQPAYQEGVVFYDSENHTLSLYNDEADVTHQLGQEQFLRVRNNTGATIPNGAAVLINGAHGNSAPTISGAIATSEASSQVVGLATHSIETDSFGYVTTYGIVRDIDTSEFSAGDEVFLSATQIGSGVAIAPTIPNYKISLGHVINSASSNGSMLVQVGNTKLGGGDLKSETTLNMSGVPFVTTISDTTAGGSQTDPLFVYDSGNNRLQLASLFIEPNVATKIGQVIKSAVSQSANLQEWQNSSENVLSYVDTSGVYTNIIGSSGTDTLRLQFGDAESNQTVSSNTNIKGLWLDFEDGSEYTAGTVNGNTLEIGTWYNTAKTIPSRIRIGATSFNVSLANSQKIDLQGTTTKFNTDVVPFTTVARDLGTASLTWRNLYASGVTASGVQLASHVPADTTNALYNEAGTLKFNGSAIDTTYDDTYVSGVAAYASGQAISNETDISYVSGIAVYASGEAGGGSSLTAGSGIVVDGANRINVHGGSGHFQNIQLETTGTEDALLLTSTDAGSDAAPVISTMRDSASPADGDYLGQLKFKGRSDTGVERVYAKITGKTLDVTNGTEDGVIEIAVRANGSNEVVSRIRNDGVRVLNDNNLCVQDGGNIGIRTISPNYPLDVEGSAHVASGLLVGDTLDVSGVATFDQVSTFQSGVKTNINTEADAATITFDMDQSNVHMVTLGDNRTLAVSNVDVGQKFLIRLQQDSTGSRTVTWWNDIKWAEGGTEPTLTTTAGKADLFGFLSPSGGYYDGFVVGQNI